MSTSTQAAGGSLTFGLLLPVASVGALLRQTTEGSAWLHLMGFEVQPGSEEVVVDLGSEAPVELVHDLTALLDELRSVLSGADRHVNVVLDVGWETQRAATVFSDGDRSVVLVVAPEGVWWAVVESAEEAWAAVAGREESLPVNWRMTLSRGRSALASVIATADGVDLHMDETVADKHLENMLAEAQRPGQILDTLLA